MPIRWEDLEKMIPAASAHVEWKPTGVLWANLWHRATTRQAQGGAQHGTTGKKTVFDVRMRTF